ncbi:MAG TPA: Flp pilus assembly protein CpaB [Terriglobales bacterium]|nr:Flp pilus assembly protein CpaB [Terriglobales bacterium]
MNRNRLILGLLLAISTGLVTSFYVYRQINARVVKSPQAPMRQVVVAAQPLTLGTRLTRDHLRTISWPADQPIAGVFADVQECVDRAVITSLVENEPIMEGKLAPKDAGAGLPAAIPEGMRAMSVSVNDVIGVAGFVVPSTMVDVLVTGSPESSNKGDTITRTVLENIRVLAAGQKVETDKDGKPQTVSVVTLMVTPEDANQLAMAATEGKIQLALRNTIDTKKMDPPSVMQARFFSGGPVAPPSRKTKRSNPVVAPPPSYVVEMFVGSKREDKSFTE